MDARTPQGRAVLLLALCGAALAAWGVLAPKDHPHLGSVVTLWVVTLAIFVPQALMAALLLWRGPGHGVGRVITAMALAGALGLVVSALGADRATPTGRWDLPWVL